MEFQISLDQNKSEARFVSLDECHKTFFKFSLHFRVISYTVFTKTLLPALIRKVLEYIDNQNYPKILYDNEYALFIDIYFYEYFHLALTLQTFLDTLSDILDKFFFNN
jgi:hypothetical protein